MTNRIRRVMKRKNMRNIGISYVSFCETEVGYPVPLHHGWGGKGGVIGVGGRAGHEVDVLTLETATCFDQNSSKLFRIFQLPTDHERDLEEL